MEHIRVDTSLQERIRINLNVTFPNLACEDLHLNVMDVAGDSQIGLEAENGFVKTKLGQNGRKFQSDDASEKVKANKEYLLEKMDEEKVSSFGYELSSRVLFPCTKPVDVPLSNGTIALRHRSYQQTPERLLWRLLRRNSSPKCYKTQLL